MNAKQKDQGIQNQGILIDAELTRSTRYAVGAHQDADINRYRQLVNMQLPRQPPYLRSAAFHLSLM